VKQGKVDKEERDVSGGNDRGGKVIRRRYLHVSGKVKSRLKAQNRKKTKRDQDKVT